MNMRCMLDSVHPVGFLVFITALAAFVLMATDCKPATGPKLPGYCYEEALFVAAHLRCVDKAESLTESRSCRAEVDRSCGIAQQTRKP